MRLRFVIPVLVAAATACASFGSSGDTPASDAGASTSDDGGAHACDGGPNSVFCDDFDDGRSDPQGAWSTLIGNTTNATFTSTTVRSAPRALGFSIAGGQATSGLARSFSLSKAKLTVDLDLYVDADPSSVEELDPVYLKVAPAPPGADNQVVALARYKNNANFEYAYSLADGGQAFSAEGLAGAVFRQWTHARFVVTQGGGGAAPTVSLSLDDGAEKTLSLDTSTVTDVVVRIGLPQPHGGNGPATVVVDNVVVVEE